MNTAFRRLAVTTPFVGFFLGILQAQPAAPRDRIAGHIDRTRTVTLRGNVHPRANPLNDRGAVDDSFPTPRLALTFKVTSAQQTDLQQLLAEQQNPSSLNYHKWLTPEQFGDRFGINQNDLDKITAWLQAEGFTIGNIARGRTWIQFSGVAGQVRNSFGTRIHRYNVNGELHYANDTEPSLPAALADVVGSIRGLNDFHPKPRAARFTKAVPEYTTSNGEHLIAPDDMAAIYDIAPLYTAGVDGSGQKIVVVGQTSINQTDIQKFRTKFNLPTQTPQTVLVPKLPDPGVVQSDLSEADLDIEWSGAVARNATIVFVYSANVFDAAQYAIDQNLAPVISMSYGFCEAMDLIDLPSFQTLAQQANSQGITWVTASGDFGAADCEDPSATLAQAGKSADVPGVIPEVTSVGGTRLNDAGGSFWSATGAALSYIPEVAWNDTASYNGLASSGGGASVFFPKPLWQTGPGVPNDGVRDVPDIALAASPQHDAVYVYSGGSAQAIGGTSVGAPTFAGMVALLNHYLVSTKIAAQPGLGNINPALYRMAQNTSGVFHDITSGDNAVPCNAGAPDCVNGLVGFNAGSGYDQATGLGSMDVSNMIHQWSSVPPVNSAVVPSIDQNPVYQQAPDSHGNPWSYTITLTEEAGVGTTLTDFTINGQSKVSQIATIFGTAAIPANGSIHSTGLGFPTLTVPATIVFGFSGVDASNRAWSTQLSVPFQGTQAQQPVAGLTNAASYQQAYAPGMIMSVYGVQMATSTVQASAIPLPNFLGGISAFVNGVPAPLYYVSPTQLNIQIPYETRPGRATLEVDTPYVNATTQFQVAAAAPGIFTFADGTINPSRSGRRGQIYTLFITGEGQVTPSIATGATPSPRTPVSNLPHPRQAVTLTIGGVDAGIQFIGIPSGLVGVTQINFTVPAGAPLGAQQLVVTVGNSPSQAANFTVTQ